MNIKNKNILKFIFKILKEKNLLKIIKYNKKIQKKLDISLEDYKNFLSIEIEIILFNDNRIKNFIRIPKNENISHFHIYFDDRREEIKKTSLDEGE